MTTTAPDFKPKNLLDLHRWTWDMFEAGNKTLRAERECNVGFMNSVNSHVNAVDFRLRNHVVPSIDRAVASIEVLQKRADVVDTKLTKLWDRCDTISLKVIGQQEPRLLQTQEAVQQVQLSQMGVLERMEKGRIVLLDVSRKVNENTAAAKQVLGQLGGVTSIAERAKNEAALAKQAANTAQQKAGAACIQATAAAESAKGVHSVMYRVDRKVGDLEEKVNLLNRFVEGLAKDSHAPQPVVSATEGEEMLRRLKVLEHKVDLQRQYNNELYQKILGARIETRTAQAELNKWTLREAVVLQGLRVAGWAAVLATVGVVGYLWGVSA